VDNLAKKQRSFCMSRIRSKNTTPEIAVRRLIHKMGYRFHLHRKDLPGKPDIVLSKHKKIIFVHGCFWHKHNCRYGRVIPKTNKKYWQDKRDKNVTRNKKDIKQLRNMGWKVMVIWERQTKKPKRITNKIAHFIAS